MDGHILFMGKAKAEAQGPTPSPGPPSSSFVSVISSCLSGSADSGRRGHGLQARCKFCHMKLLFFQLLISIPLPGRALPSRQWPRWGPLYPSVSLLG